MLYIIGPLSIDFFVTADGELHEGLLGGGAAYSAAGARVWSQEVSLISLVNTRFPEKALAEISRLGIGTEGVSKRESAPPPYAFFTYDEIDRKADIKATTKYLQLERNIPKELLPDSSSGGSKVPRLQRMPAPANLPAAVADAAGVHMAAVDIESAKLIGQHVKSFHKPLVSFDPPTGLMDPDKASDLQLALHDVDIFSPSLNQCRGFFRPSRPSIWEMAEAFSAMGPEVIAIKRGEQGLAVYQDSSRRKWHVPAYSIQPVDVTGAGHVFSGAFLAGYIETSGDPAQAAAYGSAAASLAIEGVGCSYPLEALPGLAEARRDRILQGIQSA